MKALIFANGDLFDGPAVRAALHEASDALIVAADGGAKLADRCGTPPQLIVGDLDSLSEADVDGYEVSGVAISRYSPHKDETDLELALIETVERGADWIRVIGATGDRLDQTLANVFLLMLPQVRACDVRLVAGRQSIWLVGPGTHTLSGAVGDTVSLLPWAGDAVGVTTGQLEYPLRDETLVAGPARGVSNVMQAAEAQVTLRSGWLVMIHSQGQV